MGLVLKKFGKAGVKRFFAEMMMREVPMEQVAEHTQDAIDTAIANPDRSWNDYLEERHEVAYQTLIATMTQTTLMSGAHGAARRIATRKDRELSRYATELDAADRALNEQEQMDGMATDVADWNVKGRDKGATKSFIEDVLGAEAEVNIPAEDAEAFFQAHPELLEELPEDLAEDIRESLDTKSDITMTKADYLTNMAEFHDELSDKLRNDIDGMNALEANEWIDQATPQFEKEAERILEEQEMANETQASADRVGVMVRDQLIATQRMNPRAAETSAALHRAFSIVYSDKLGITPEELYEKLGLRIQGTPVMGEALDQPGTPEFQQWFGESKVVDEKGEPLAVYHGTGNLDGFTEFKPHLTGKGNDQYGSGFYFTSEPVTASGYASDYVSPSAPVGADKIGGAASPGILPVHLAIKNPIKLTGGTSNLRQAGLDLSAKQVRQMLNHSEAVKRSMDDENMNPLGDHFDTFWETGPEEWMLDDIAETYKGDDVESIEVELFDNDSKAFRKALSEVTGYDGVEVTFTESGEKHLVAWFPEQIKSQFNRGTYDPTDPNILYQEDTLNKEELSELALQLSESSALRADESIDAGARATQLIADFFSTKTELDKFFNLLKVPSKLFAFSEPSEVVDEQAPSVKGRFDSVDSHIKTISDLASTETFTEQGFSGLDIEGQRTMLTAMTGLIHNPQILNSIVELIPVDVVNDLGGSQGAANVILHNFTVLKDSIAVGADLEIAPIDRASAPEVGEAGILAEMLPSEFLSAQLDSVISSREGFSALSTLYDSHKMTLTQDGKTVQPRAQIQFTEFGATITLLEGADLSSWLHESGHFFFEAMNKLAAESPEIMTDLNTMLDFIGVQDSQTWNQMTLEQRREGHEQVARAFEAYLFEGKAPSLEMESLFQKFRDWLVNVYENLRNLNIELTDEVREVFDRMLATEDQLRSRAVADSYESLFESAEDAGMTAGQWQKYQSLNEVRQAKAAAELSQRSLKDMKWLSNAKSRELKRLQKEAREKRRTIRLEVAEEVGEETVYKADRFLKKGEYIDIDGEQQTVEVHKLHKPTVRDMYEGERASAGEVNPEIDNLQVAIAKLGGINQVEAEAQGIDPAHWTGTAASTENQPIFGKRIFLKRGGESMDSMAEKLYTKGYLAEVSPNELLNKLDKALRGDNQYSLQVDMQKVEGIEALDETMVDWEALGRARLGSEGIHPDDAASLLGFTSGDQMIRQLLEAELQKERIDRLTDARMLDTYGDITSPEALEVAAIEALHNEAHTRFLHTELKALAKGTGTKNVLARAAKAYAERAIARKKVKDIRPGQYSAAESRAARNAEKALVKGDRDEASQHKRAQVLNNHFFRAATNAKIDIDKMVRFLKKFTKTGTRKNIDQEYLDQVDSMLEQYDLKKGVSLKELGKRKSIREWSESQEELGFTPIIDETLLETARKKHYKEMTVEELSGLADSVKNIEHLGRLKKTLLKQKDKREFEAHMLEARESIEENAKRTVKERGEPSDVVGIFASWMRNLGAIHRKFSSIIREMDGLKDNGKLFQLLTQGMGESGDAEADMNREDTLALAELFDPIMGDIHRGGLPVNIYAKKYAIPGTDISMTKEELIMFGMNWGNEGNRQRLMDGGITGKRALSPEDANAILDMLTKSDWDFIQGTLDHIAKKRDEIGKQERRLTGVTPEWIEATPIETKYGTYPGGYFPAKYDTVLSTRSELLDAVNDLRMAMKGAFGRATTRKSYTQKRAQEVHNRPMLLRFTAISRHINEVNHRLAWQDWITDANRILAALDGPMTKHYGPELTGELRDTVKAVAEGDAQSTSAFEQFINRIRVGSTIVGMGWRITTALIQPSGLAQSWTRVGSKYMNRGLMKYFKNPLEAGRIADEKSTLMRNRALTMQREVSEVLNNVKTGDKASKFKASTFYMIQKMQRTVDIPTWWGAYYKAIDELHLEGATTEEHRQEIEERAIQIANQTVKDTQSGGQIGDLAKIQRGPAYAKLFTNFYSYFSATYNMNLEAVKKYKKPSDSIGIAQDLIILNFVPALFSMALHELLKNECDMDPECLAEKLASEQLSFLLGQTLPTREMGAGVGALFGLETYDYKGPAGLRPLADLYSTARQVGQLEGDMALFKALNKTAGSFLHYPAGQINATIDGIMAVESGEVEGVGTIGAVLAGPPRK